MNAVSIGSPSQDPRDIPCHNGETSNTSCWMDLEEVWRIRRHTFSVIDWLRYGQRIRRWPLERPRRAS